MKNSETKQQKQKGLTETKKKPYEKPAIIQTTKIETLAGTCVNTVGQACVPPFD